MPSFDVRKIVVAGVKRVVIGITTLNNERIKWKAVRNVTNVIEPLLE